MDFSTIPCAQRIEKPWGYEIIWTPPGLPRVGKMLFIKAGCKFSWQYHDVKEETQTLAMGKALIWLENKRGEVEKIPMKPFEGYHIKVGQKHRLEAILDSYFFEVSSPESGNTFRVEDDYDRPTETEADRERERVKL